MKKLMKVVVGKLHWLALAGALGIVVVLCSGSCDVEPPSDLGQGAPSSLDAADEAQPGMTRRTMTCGAGHPSIVVEDKVRVVATCPADKYSMRMEVPCQAPPLVARAVGDEIIVLCPEDVAER
jgi:hypothetical protein